MTQNLWTVFVLILHSISYFCLRGQFAVCIFVKARIDQKKRGANFALSKCLFSSSLISECCPGRLEKRTRWVEKCTEPYFGWWLEPKPPTCLCGPTRLVQHNNWKSAGRLAGAAGLTNPCGTLTVQRRCNGGPMVSIRDFGCICVVTTI